MDFISEALSHTTTSRIRLRYALQRLEQGDTTAARAEIAAAQDALFLADTAIHDVRDEKNRTSEAWRTISEFLTRA